MASRTFRQTKKLFKALNGKKSLFTLTVFTAGTFLYLKRPTSSVFDNIPSENNVKLYSEKESVPSSRIPTRVDGLHRMKSGEVFDVLVIGGGCTGSGIALDAANRGLNVAMIDKMDYSAGTSSRSTKLIHGGVRYLEKAFKNLDIKQFSLVFEALSERKHLLSIAPNLSHELPIIVPLYYGYPEIFFYIPYFWFGMKLYDFMSGSKGRLQNSGYLSKEKVIERFPMLNRKGLKGAIIYYDGMHNDARMNIAIALTAAVKGAAVSNHVEMKHLLKDTNGRVSGARLLDRVTGDEFDVKSRSVINATGCFADSVREDDEPEGKKIVSPSGGAHVVLPNGYCPRNMGMLVPNTDDGRVLFFLPWEGSTLAGTTDTSCEIKDDPRPTKKEVSFILKELRKYLGSDLKIQDVNASWSGIRPLAKDLKSKDTASISRNHEIEVSKSGLVTITGGKWTTYRSMAEQTLDTVLKHNENIKPKFPKRSSKDVPLVGASGWSISTKTELMRKGLPEDVAIHLSNNYGYLAYEIADLALCKNLSKRISKGYPFIEAEVLFGIRHEHAVQLIDVIARRMRLSFLNSESARESLPRVLNLMASEKKWDSAKRFEEFWKTVLFLETMNVQDEKRHFWANNTTPEQAFERVQEALGECPLEKDDLGLLLNHLRKQGPKVKTNSFVPSLKKLSIENSDIRKHLDRIGTLLDQSQREEQRPEDLVFVVCGAMIEDKLKSCE